MENDWSFRRQKVHETRGKLTRVFYPLIRLSFYAALMTRDPAKLYIIPTIAGRLISASHSSRKLPLINPGLLQLGKDFWVGL